MDKLIGAAEAARRTGRSKEWIIKLCQQGRIPGAYKVGQWLIPPGAKIQPTGSGRPLRTLEIPSAREAGGKRSGKKGKR